jgi:hypothetical protein
MPQYHSDEYDAMEHPIKIPVELSTYATDFKAFNALEVVIVFIKPQIAEFFIQSLLDNRPEALLDKDIEFFHYG